MKQEIVKVLSKSLDMPEDKVASLLEVPKDPTLGDYALPCFTFARELKKNPVEIAKDFAKKIKSNSLEKVAAIGPYVNLFVSKKEFVINALTLANKKDFGKGKSKGTIVLDYSHPNVAKHFGIHNLRSTLIGHALYNILTFSGKKVISVNHLGDWGTQFGKLIVAYKKYSKSTKLEDIASLNSLYVKFHEDVEKDPSLDESARSEFKKLELGDKTNLRLWKKFLDISLKEFKETYQLLGIKFDQIKGESFYRTRVKDLVKLLNDKKLLEESEGAKVVSFEDIPPCIITKSDEASTYATRDISAIFERLKENPEKIVYVVDVRQSLHFEQIFRVAEKLGIPREKLVHVKFGLMKFPDMEMSTRKGKVILFEYLLEKAQEEILKVIKEKSASLKNKEKVARQIALASVVFQDIQNNRIHDVVFDWAQALNFEGKSAPYLLYTYARAQSIIKKSKKKPSFKKIDKVTESEFSLSKKIALFPEIVEQAAKNYEPHILAEYAYDLSQRFNEFYHSSPVLDTEEEPFRLSLVYSFAHTLKSALALLGIPVLEKM